MTTRMRSVLGVGLAGCLLIAGAGTGDRQPKLVFNTTASVPLGFYWVDGKALGVGDLAVVRPPRVLARWLAQRRYLPLNVPLIKAVAATGSARVCGADGLISINGSVVGRARFKDRWGRALRPFDGCRTLDEDEVFLFNGAAPTSLDSRYFGPLRRGDIVGRARPLWTWERGQ